MSVYLKTINPKIKIIAVEAEDSACFNLAYKNGKPTSLKHVGIFADGVAVKKIGLKTFKLADPILNENLFFIAEKEIKRIENNDEDISRFRTLMKLYDQADIINDIV